jgi:sugar transferase (PEP-CTERM/EpsH1 system associated)
MRILWLKTELLHPIDKGGKIRTYHMLKELKKEHHITYLTLDDGKAAADALEKAAEYASEVVTIPHQTAPKFSSKFYLELIGNIVSDLPYALQKYVSPEMRQKIESTTAENKFDILICDFLAPAVNVPSELAIPTLLFQHNVEAMIWQRHLEVARNPLKKAFLKKQWRRMWEYEGRACRRFNHVVAVSKEDADTMTREYKVKNISDVPTGVDTEYFRPSKRSDQIAPEIVFTGSMDWLPNEDAIQWFTKEILPVIKAKVPNATFTVVGRNPFPSLLELSRRDSSIKVTGRVPDVRPYMEKASVYVVPIRIGGGTRLKIYEAMAMGLPVVSTTVGAEGLGVSDSEGVTIRDCAGEFAETTIGLLTNPCRAADVGCQARKFVQSKISWSQASNSLIASCLSAVHLV